MKIFNEEYGQFIKRSDKVEGSINTNVTARAGKAFNFDNGTLLDACELVLNSENANCRHHICVSLEAAIQLRDGLNREIARATKTLIQPD
jgi:hypothetical protein